MSEIVTVEYADGVATLTLNRPQALNALDEAMILALGEATAAVEHDASVRVVVLRGAGDHFMAGGDLKRFNAMLQEPGVHAAFHQLIHRFHRSILSLRQMPKPVLASLNGAVAGGGLSLMMACDLAVAADTAYFTLAYSSIGASPDGGSTFSLPRIVGLRKAMEIAFLGDRFDAATAKDLGLVNWVVPAADLAAETTKLARRLADRPTYALGRTKRMLVESLDTPLAVKLGWEADSFADCATRPDFAEGLAAFIGKRKPQFNQSN